MNCIDNECKYLLHTWDCEMYCSLLNKEVSEDIDETQCVHFTQARTCINCKHSLETVYETGTIDDIEYRCPFQNKKLMYDDSDAYNSHFADVPECNINKWEEF